MLYLFCMAGNCRWFFYCYKLRPHLVICLNKWLVHCFSIIAGMHLSGEIAFFSFIILRFYSVFDGWNIRDAHLLVKFLQSKHQWSNFLKRKNRCKQTSKIIIKNFNMKSSHEIKYRYYCKNVSILQNKLTMLVNNICWNLSFYPCFTKMWIVLCAYRDR